MSGKKLEKEYEEFQKMLAEKILSLRKAKSLTQEDMFLEDFLSVRSYQDIETGKAAPRLRSLFAICKTLEISPSDLFKLD
jgi:transcriptional regulator with XRE-family HTH domain